MSTASTTTSLHLGTDTEIKAERVDTTTWVRIDDTRVGLAIFTETFEQAEKLADVLQDIVDHQKSAETKEDV